ncbi:MAG TPA: VOC family protein [Bacteroidia bacterium]|jgi:catechol 2,3-dioxygenase-like lactoylglutathione lyase family enzyme|nr:VOC family protein [Bacteroidia bacterium]
MSYTIAGIQQIGIGIPDVHQAFKWYREHFGMDIPILDDPGESALMLPYTGGQARKRHAILAINLKGGGGFEIWQYTSRIPQPPAFEIKMGDLGLFWARIKSENVAASFAFLKAKRADILGELRKDPQGMDYFFVRDPWGNLFQVVKGSSWFGKGMQLTGGPEGCMMGVTDMERSLKFYCSLLGYDTVIYDHTGVFDDLKGIAGGERVCRRVLITHSKQRTGAFSRLLGNSHLELIQLKEDSPRKIYENRFWGDLGFIHLSFDIQDMADLRKVCEAAGHPFTVDSANSFDMGEAAGHFTYIEDPDGTLIEFVETHKIPVLKKLGWYLDLRKRDASKALPDWMLKTLKFSRVK